MRYLLILICVMMIGCDRDEPAGPTSGGGGGEHVHAAPHGGVLAELGEHEAAAELVLDRATGTLDLYLLDSHAENPVRIAQESITATVVIGDEKFDIELKPVASQLTGEKVGDSSQFRGQDSRLTGSGPLVVTLAQVNVRGKDYKNVSIDVPAPVDPGAGGPTSAGGNTP